MSAEPDVEAGPAEGGTDEPVAEEEPLPEGKYNPQQKAADARLKHAQQEVQEVIEIMQKNVELTLERDAKLAELDDRSDKLQEGAAAFEKAAGAMANKGNTKMMIIGGIIALAVGAYVYMNYYHH